MNRTEFYELLNKAFKDTDVDWDENFVGDEDLGEVYVKFKSIVGDDWDDWEL